MARLVSGQAAEMPDADQAVFDAADRAVGRILTCLCFPRSDVVIEIVLRDETAAAPVNTVGAAVEASPGSRRRSPRRRYIVGLLALCIGGAGPLSVDGYLRSRR